VSRGGGDHAAHRDALFDLAVERALTYLTRARAAQGRDPAAIERALEVWYLKTRFASRVPLSGIVAALARRPVGDPAAWRWRGGPDGDWEGRGPPTR
jgi:hypothetical protein